MAKGKLMTRTDIMANHRAARPTRRAAFPNIAAASPRTIRQAIQAEVDTIADDSLKRLSPNASRALLAVLALCYARQVYSSTVAATLVARDLYFPSLCGGRFPDACVLRQFRAENREAIHRCLTAALYFLVEQKISSGVVTRVNVPQVAEEANRRITMAMFVDSLELDGTDSRAV
jgi:hypothetical protein